MPIIMIMHGLTAALVFTKLTGLVDMSWWLALSPSLAAVGVAFVVGTAIAYRQEKKKKKR